VQVCDALEDFLDGGGNIVDYHGCDFFPERWVPMGELRACSAVMALLKLVNIGFVGLA
jgi:hypothetical protein